MASSPGPENPDLAWRGAIEHALAPVHGAVAHDLRAPLNAIGLNLALVRRTLERDADKARRWLEVVEAEKQRLECLLQAQLALVTSTELDDTPKAGDVADLLRLGELLLRSLAERRGVELRLEKTSAAGFWRCAALSRALLASISLGIVATPAGASLCAAGRPGEAGAIFVLAGESLPEADALRPLWRPLAGQLEISKDQLSIRIPNIEGAP